MRLLKTGPYVPGDEKLEVIQKWGRDVPPYAILSHTWSPNPDDEVLLSDVQHGTCGRKPAFAKLEKAMERAKLDGYGWLWIDTCCIDKTSSVELTEAINSMYDYYRASQKCYTYLSDVESEKAGPEFKASRWWSRGWTLQELLAPRELEFFNSNWKSIGFKHTLHQDIAEKTNIDSGYLTGIWPVESASVAKRMSWAASRETTREEDTAYAMIGLFEVNMPMLYGEGASKAFLRLQEEIMRVTEDQSIFAWVKKFDDRDTAGGLHGLLADSPADFELTGNTISYPDTGDSRPSSMSPRGLNIRFHVTPKSEGTFVAALRCPVPGQGNSGWLAVYLRKLNTGTNQYARVDSDRLAAVSDLGFPQEIYVRQKFSLFPTPAFYPHHFLQLRSLVCESSYKELEEYRIVRSTQKPTEGKPSQPLPPTQPVRWTTVPTIYQIDKTAGALAAALLIKRTADEESFIVMLGASTDFDVGVQIVDGTKISPEEFQSFDDMRSAFKPQQLGNPEHLKHHTVRVSAEEYVRADQKFYFVDIAIKAFPLPPTATDFLEGAIDSAIGPNRGAARVDFRNKVKRRFLLG